MGNTVFHLKGHGLCWYRMINLRERKKNEFVSHKHLHREQNSLRTVFYQSKSRSFCDQQGSLCHDSEDRGSIRLKWDETKLTAVPWEGLSDGWGSRKLGQHGGGQDAFPHSSLCAWHPQQQLCFLPELSHPGWPLPLCWTQSPGINDSPIANLSLLVPEATLMSIEHAWVDCSLLFWLWGSAVPGNHTPSSTWLVSVPH